MAAGALKMFKHGLIPSVIIVAVTLRTYIGQRKIVMMEYIRYYHGNKIVFVNVSQFVDRRVK